MKTDLIPDFFKEEPEWISNLAYALKESWTFFGKGERLNWSFSREGNDNVIVLKVAPAYQEYSGGPTDGKVVWTPFVFDISKFIDKTKNYLKIMNFGVSSLNEPEATQPMLMIDATHDDIEVNIAVFLEPPPGTGIAEVIDTSTMEIRKKIP